jgi:PAS domain S-box-containing protein
MLAGALSESTVVLCDTELRVVAAEGPPWLDSDAGGLRGRLLTETIAESRLSLLEPQFEAALAGEAGYAEYGSADEGMFAVQVLPLRASSDEVTGVLILTRDVTAERSAELELLRSEVALAQAQRIAHVGSWEWQVDSGEVRWSDELYRVFGLSPREFEPSLQSYLERVHPADRKQVEELVQNAIATRSPLCYQCRIVRADGDVRALEARGEVLLDDHGSPERMLGTVQDITERRNAEEQLAVLSRFWELSPSLLSIAGLDGYLKRVNPAYERLLGYSERQLLERPYIELVHPGDHERLLDALARLAETGGETRDFELRMRRNDGSYVSVVTSAKLGFDGGLIYAISRPAPSQSR